MSKLCPLMSRPVVHPCASTTHRPGQLHEVKCHKDDCALWDEQAQRCSHLTANLAWAEVLEQIGKDIAENDSPSEGDH